jgi:ubiquinone/menaquinone biosynthesis C-methylase UbiE
MTETAIEHFWDELAPAYERWCEPGTARFAKAALDRAALPEGSAVLDVAAGTGALAVAAANRGHLVRAIDTSPGMIRRAAHRLSPYPGCSAEVMDGTGLRYADNGFDAAFSMLGALYWGKEMAAKALTEMARVVRPGGVVGVVHWAGPVGGGRIFVPLARAINRLHDPEVGEIVFPVGPPEYLSRAEVERVLTEARCVDVQAETLEVAAIMPAPEVFMDALEPFFRAFPQYAAAVSRHGQRLRETLAEEVSLMEPALDRVNVAHGRVPAR